MTSTLREAFRTILEQYPTEAERPAAAMPESVAEAFDQLTGELERQFGVRASANYDVEHNAEFLNTRQKLPYIQFRPRSEVQNDRNPRLRVSILFPSDMRGLFVVLTDVRDPGTGPEPSEKADQRDRVRALLGRETEIGWQFDSGTPRLVVGEGTEGESHPFAAGTVFYRYYEAGDLPSDDEVRKDLDGLLRLREVYNEKFQSKNLLEPSEPSEPDSGVDGVSRTPGTPPSGLEQDSAADQLAGELPETQNLLLYGPPGTGKTYSTARRAVELCGELDRDEEVEEQELKRRYRRLRSEGRIEFVTFHQSFGYEEFVEGIRPVMSESSEESEESGGEVDYQCEMGVFKRIALLAASEGLDLTEDDRQFEARWRALQQRVEEADEVTCESRQAEYRVETLDNDRFRLVRIDGEASTTYRVEKKTVKRWWNKRHELGDDFAKIDRRKVDATLSRTGGFTPNWVMYRLIIEQGAVDPSTISTEMDEFSGLSREKRINNASTYLDERREERGADAFSGFEGAKPYVLIIDEINRGNISKILGELITLLEPSKRLTREDELLVKLPYSKDTFGVPPNLHILGTMNTADRSIALLDAALRRRFEYSEMMPDRGVLVEVLLDRFNAESVDDLDDDEAYLFNLVPALLETINDRIEFLYDRDHQLGHTYFMGVTDLKSLRDAFVERIIPLLKEYFYGTWQQLGLALGSPYDRRGNPGRGPTDEHAYDDDGTYAAPMVWTNTLEEQRILRMDHQDYENELSWEVHPDFEQTDDEERLREFFEAVLPPEIRGEVRAGNYIRKDDASGRT